MATVTDPVRIDIGIKLDNRKGVATELAFILADEYVLFTKTRNAHWNIEGPDFYEKHKFFESQFELLDDFIDDVAERIRMLGCFAPATLKTYLSITRLTEDMDPTADSREYISELAKDHDSLISSMRASLAVVQDTYKDAGTTNFITDLIEKHEKMAWFLRTHLIKS